MCQRNSKLSNIRDESNNLDKSIHAFCPRRWKRGETLKSVLNNCDELLELWDWSLNNFTNTEMKGRVRGDPLFMEKFLYFSGCFIGIEILGVTYNLSQ